MQVGGGIEGGIESICLRKGCCVKTHCFRWRVHAFLDFGVCRIGLYETNFQPCTHADLHLTTWLLRLLSLFAAGCCWSWLFAQQARPLALYATRAEPMHHKGTALWMVWRAALVILLQEARAHGVFCLWKAAFCLQRAREILHRINVRVICNFAARACRFGFDGSTFRGWVDFSLRPRAHAVGDFTRRGLTSTPPPSTCPIHVGRTDFPSFQKDYPLTQRNVGRCAKHLRVDVA